MPGHLQTHEMFSPAHDAEVARGSLLHWLTDSDGLAVNSFHHQAADRIGAGLEVAARAPDGTVEALWDPSARFTLGVQWHAEFLTHRAEQASLLSGLVHAACGMAPQLSLGCLARELDDDLVGLGADDDLAVGGPVLAGAARDRRGLLGLGGDERARPS